MLSAAHALAMDAKNLLDVVDSVRLRYPDLFQHSNTNFESLGMSLQNLQSTSINNDDNEFDNHSKISTINETINPNENQTYQNVTQIMNQDEQQIMCNQSGIYDNERDPNDEIDKMNFDVQALDCSLSSDQNSSSIFLPAKPPVAAKPINLQKLKTNYPSSISMAAPNENIDPLKIIENDDDTCTN